MPKPTADLIKQIAEYKQNGCTNLEIARRTGVSIYKVKEIVKSENLYLTAEQRRLIPYKAKISKNPNAMSDMRACLISESRKKQSQTLSKTYQDRPELRQAASNTFKSYWKQLENSGLKEVFVNQRSRTSTLTKLSLPDDKALDSLFQSIKADVEAGVGTVSTLATKYGISASTACRGFHKRGWTELLNSTASQAQLDIYNYVKSKIPDQVVLLSDRSAIYQELDVYCPEIKFAIEYNGLFFHSEAAVESGLCATIRNRHLQKFKRCERAGIDLLAIYEDEWACPQKQVLIKAMIDHRLGVSQASPISAAKLKLMVLKENKLFKNFFEVNHIDGHANASYAVALVDSQNQIVMCASVRKDQRGRLEIARMATDYRYRVLGGASRLIKHLPRPIYSYSNNRLSTGNVYIKSGFEFVKDTLQPSYWYTDLNKRVYRTKCRRISDPEILAKYPTESDQARNGCFSVKLFGDLRPLYRIEDYGHKLWVLK
jgi:hypothetical protein